MISRPRVAGGAGSPQPARRAIVLAVLLSALLVPGAGQGQGQALPREAGPWPVAPELWDRPRSAQAVREQPGVRAAVAAWLATPGASLAIRPAGGQNDGVQAEELRHWLIALAIDAASVQVVAAAATAQPGAPLMIELRQPSRLPLKP